jgi:hypothetical protein
MEVTWFVEEKRKDGCRTAFPYQERPSETILASDSI